MRGTEKQISWAEDIKADFNRVCDEVLAYYDEKIEAERENAEQRIAAGKIARHYNTLVSEREDVIACKEHFAAEDDARFWINARNDFQKNAAAFPYQDCERIRRFIDLMNR